MLEFLGFERDPVHCTYDGLCERYETEILEAEHEEIMSKEISTKLFLKYFPERTHPFWNMKQNDTSKILFNKVDVILHGQETIGSAERSCDPKAMKWNFLNQTDGEYANLLFSKFGKERVMKELDEFLDHDFFPRFGGGIGINRMARSMKLEGII